MTLVDNPPVHTHEYKPVGIAETQDFWYGRCVCGLVLGSPIESLEDKRDIINYLATWQ